MAQQGSDNPTDLELDILKVLWAASPLTARQIRESLAGKDRVLAHSTVITMTQRMVAKGQLEQLAPVEGKAFRFAPLLAEEDVSKRMLGDLVNRVFDGSAEAVVLRLFDDADLDDDVLKKLRRMVNRKMRESKQ